MRPHVVYYHVYVYHAAERQMMLFYLFLFFPALLQLFHNDNNETFSKMSGVESADMSLEE